MAKVFAHLLGPRGAVQTDHVDTQRLQSRESRVYFGAHQHGPGGFHGDLDKQGKARAGGAHCIFTAVDGRLGLQKVLGSLDHKGVGPALEESLCLTLKRGLEKAVGGVAEGREFGSGPNGT